MEKKTTVSLKDTVYKQVISLICSNELNSDQIITESQLCDRFGVSKAPVREALIQLCHEDVLRSIPRCGYQVVQINIQSIHELTELRFFLELSSLKNVEKNLTGDAVLMLKSYAHIPDSENKDIWASWHNNNKFHLALTGLAGNAQVDKALQRALDTCTRAYAQLFQDNRPIVAPSGPNYHDHIIQALENHDLFTAHDYLKRDILTMEQLLLGASQKPDTE